jgi:murein endopeptidase
MMTQSTKDARYFRLADLFGFAWLNTAGVEMIWGKKHMIEFLIKLEKQWTDPFDKVYEQIDHYGNFAKIPLGDISREGGGPSRSQVERFAGHKSHRCGVDIDIFVIGKSGYPSRHLMPSKDNSGEYNDSGEYDFKRTSELATAILIAGGQEITDIFIGDKRLVKLLNDKKSQHTKIWHDSPQHDNHFHIRLQNKDHDTMCFS